MEKSSTLHDAAATNPRQWATTDPPQWRGGAGLACDESATLLRLTKLFERSSEAAKIGVWECSLDGEQLTWTDVVYDIFDLPRGSRLDRAEILRFYPSTSRAELERVRSRAIECGEGLTLDVQIHTAKGRDKWIRITATVEREHEVPIRIFGLKQDITTERLLVEQTRYLAEYDSLTGLANRATFQRSLDALASASPPRGTLLLLDLDGFKQVNDRHGHAQGDACLQQLARRLGSVCADAKVVARIGGDEFAILIDQQASHEHTKSVSERIIEAFRSPIMSGSESFVLGASIGIAHFGAGQNDSDAASIFTDADLALYEAKSAGKNAYCFFEQKLRGKLNKRVSTIATIEAALTASRLTLCYQPIVRIATGALLGFEALLRHHTVGGQIVGPVEFTDAMDDPALSARVGGGPQGRDWSGRAMA